MGASLDLETPTTESEVGSLLTPLCLEPISYLVINFGTKWQRKNIAMSKRLLEFQSQLLSRMKETTLATQKKTTSSSSSSSTSSSSSSPASEMETP